MSHYMPSNDGLRSLCAEVDDEEGPGPNLHSLRKSRSASARDREAKSSGGARDRKAHQLCRQVGQALGEVLAECADVVLQGLRVEGVEPCPDASRLLVTVAPIDNRPPNVAEAAIVVDHLQRASGHLRTEVAMAVTRKRAPLLLYRLAEPART
jgi:ribosome-binding factor A